MQDCGQNWYCNHIQITVERRIYLFLSILLMDSYVNNNKKAGIFDCTGSIFPICLHSLNQDVMNISKCILLILL